MNPKKDKILYAVWFTKTQAQQLEEAIESGEWNDARVLFEQAFMEGLICKR